MDCFKTKQKIRTDKILLLIEDLNKQQKEILDYIEKLEKLNLFKQEVCYKNKREDEQILPRKNL